MTVSVKYVFLSLFQIQRHKYLTNTEDGIEKKGKESSMYREERQVPWRGTGEKGHLFLSYTPILKDLKEKVKTCMEKDTFLYFKILIFH